MGTDTKQYEDCASTTSEQHQEDDPSPKCGKLQNHGGNNILNPKP